MLQGEVTEERLVRLCNRDCHGGKRVAALRGSGVGKTFAPVVLALRLSSSEGSNMMVTEQELRSSRDLEKLLANGQRDVS